MVSTVPSPLEHRDSGSIVMGWLLKLVVGLGLFAIVLFDVVSVGTARLQVTDQADTAARASSETWVATRSASEALRQAVATAAQSNAHNVVDPASFRVDRDGTVHLTIRRTAATLVVQRVGPLRSWGRVESAGHARYLP